MSTHSSILAWEILWTEEPVAELYTTEVTWHAHLMADTLVTPMQTKL